jgi:putative nucleotidyltransferase with HDIG domain
MTNPDKTLWQRIALAFAFLVVIVYFYPHPHASHYKYEQGRPWNYAKLIAPFDVPVHPDSASVSQALDSLQASFVPIFTRASVNVDSIVNVAVKRMNALQTPSALPQMTAVVDTRTRFYSSLRQYLTSAYNKGVISDTLPSFLEGYSANKMRMLNGKVLHEVSTRQFVRITAMMQHIDSLANVNKCSRLLQNSGLQAMLVPSIVFDEAENTRILANEKALITIDRGVIQRGQTIIDKGAIISSQDYTNLRTYEQMLQSQNSETQRNDFLMLIGQILYVATILIALMGYIYFFDPKVWQNNRALLFLLSMTGIFFLLAAIIEAFLPGGIYLLPMAIVPILILVFLNARLALWTSIAGVLLCAAITTFPLEFILLQFAATAAAVFSLRELTQRSQLLRTSVFVGVAYWIAYISLQLMLNGSFDDFSWRIVASLTVNAVLTSMTYVLMFVIERVFGFTSNITLVELTDGNSPLLRKLCDECPGTFQHSVAVGTLATDAARLVGANELLVRAGAMYHDVGKMNNPIFFTENQHGVNPHDGLTALKSAEIIIGHVTDGVRIATKAKLPDVVIDFIREHHGAGKAKYFYITYCRNHPDEYVDPAPFTYPGPNPRSLETSILMMADSVEAASRSLTEHTQKAVTDLVDKIIDGQIAEGLHNNSPLSFRDVGTIKAAFVKRILTMYHSRISYPDAPTAPKTAQ